MEASVGDRRRGQSFSKGDNSHKGSKFAVVDVGIAVLSRGIVVAESEIGSGKVESMMIVGCPLIPMVFCTGVSGLVGYSTGNPGTKSL